GGGPIRKASLAICGSTPCTRGDQPGAKGVYHINAIDEVTQWQIVAATEFINQTVARLLNKLLIEQTQSRPRHSNDNGLVETKNGAVIRKHMGYGYIDAEPAERIQYFYSAHCNPYLNYHRPCAQADIEVDGKGRTGCFYRRYQTPLETLLALPHPAQYLREGLTVAVLQRIAAALSDTEAAQPMQQAKRKLFEYLRQPAEGRWK